MSHYKVICEYCGTMITQCRCPSQDKEIRYKKCNKCKDKSAQKRKEATIAVKIKSLPGATIHAVALDAIKVSKQIGYPVETIFNGVNLTIWGHDKVEAVVKRFNPYL
jgi:hypothetical protein